MRELEAFVHYQARNGFRFSLLFAVTSCRPAAGTSSNAEPVFGIVSDGEAFFIFNTESGYRLAALRSIIIRCCPPEIEY